MTRLAILVLSVSCAAPGAALAQPLDAARPPAPSDVVVTSGEHVMRVAPDVAYVTVVAESRSKAPREAQRLTAETMAAVQQRLKTAGLAEAAMQTRAVDLQPEYDYAEGRQLLRGYVARNTLEVRVGGVARVAEVIDAAVAAGASRVEGLRFDLEKRDELEREALTRAVQDAVKRAAAIAAGAGRAVGAIVRIEDGRVPAAPEPRPIVASRMAMAEAVAAAPPPTPIQAGELEVSARVTVVVRLQ
jgi:hypothetical protein